MIKSVSVLLIQLPNQIICGGVLLPGQRVLSANECIPENYTSIKVKLPGTSGHLNIRNVQRRTTVLIHVSHFRHQKYH